MMLLRSMIHAARGQIKAGEEYVGKPKSNTFEVLDRSGYFKAERVRRVVNLLDFPFQIQNRTPKELWAHLIAVRPGSVIIMAISSATRGNPRLPEQSGTESLCGTGLPSKDRRGPEELTVDSFKSRSPASSLCSPLLES